MNENELHEHLIDYVEGNISPEQKGEIESLILRSPQVQNDLDIIRLAMNGLQTVSEDDVPVHYFTNFLPRLRERLDADVLRLPVILPVWLRFMNTSFAASLVIVSIVLMYQSFKPEELNSPIFSMANEIDRLEIISLVDETSDYGTTAGIIRGAESFIGDISNINVVESRLTEDLFVLDVSSYQSENELFSDMGDIEIEKVLDRLDRATIQ
jgi:hypothetical protein